MLTMHDDAAIAREVMRAGAAVEYRPAAELFRDRDRRLLALKRAMRDIGPLTGS